MESLKRRLSEYRQKDIYPMHMPGHKRNELMFTMTNPYGLDITEIDGFDNLHDATGILKHSMEKAADIYQSEETYYLVNGSTVGLLAGIMAATKKGDRILVARNCHKAVYHAMYLHELEPVYLYPEYVSSFDCYGALTVETVRKALEIEQEIRLIVITSPTYEGIVSDIQGIVEVAHERKIPVLVDEAHGAHFGFHYAFPDNGIKNGADLVIHSLHKTMPSFTQTALLHRNGTLVSRQRVKKYVTMLQSSSPSYLLMASMDTCINRVKQQQNELFEKYATLLNSFYEKMKQLNVLRILTEEVVREESSETFVEVRKDPSKIIICTKESNVTGAWLYNELLEKYKIQLEMASKNYVIAMTSICDTVEGMTRLENALLSIDHILERKEEKKNIKMVIPHPIRRMNAYEAEEYTMESVLIEESIGRIAAEYIYLYPPGIPLLVPGEEISKELIKEFEEYKGLGLELKGLVHEKGYQLNVIKEE